MKNSDIAQALLSLRPNSEWTLTGDDYSNLVWLDDSVTPPTIEEIENLIKNPIPKAELSIDEKLASVGLSLDSLKTALGL